MYSSKISLGMKNTSKLDNKPQKKSLINGLEDHVILRVPKALTEKVNQFIDSPSPEEAIQVVHEEDNLYIFKVGKISYYATMRNLPTVVESHKTKNTEELYKSATVSQVLEVHNVTVEGNQRPQIDVELDDGLTPALKGARSQRFPKVKPVASEEPSPALVKQIDAELFQIVKNLEDSGQDNEKFEYAEVIKMEHYMQYFDEVTEIKKGNDNFLSGSRAAYDKAYAKYIGLLNDNASKPISSSSSHAPKSKAAALFQKQPRTGARVTKELPSVGSKASPSPSPSPESGFISSKILSQLPPSPAAAPTPSNVNASPNTSSEPRASPLAESPSYVTGFEGELNTPGALLTPGGLPTPGIGGSPMDLQMSPSPMPAQSPLSQEDILPSPSPPAFNNMEEDTTMAENPGNAAAIQELDSQLEEAGNNVADLEKKVAEAKNMVIKIKHQNALKAAKAKLEELEKKKSELLNN